MWLEKNWDHKFLAWIEDPLLSKLAILSGEPTLGDELWTMMSESIVWTSFNPTAENMAEFLLTRIGPTQLEGTGCTLTSVTIEETRKCSVSCHLEA